MRKIYALFFFAFLMMLQTASAQVIISEFHYDNTGADANEQIEVFGPAGTNLAGWSIVLYNGSAPAAAVTYGTAISLSGTIPNLCTINAANYGVLVFTATGLQNGTADGMALVNPSNVVVELLSYEGILTASNGPAAGQTSTDVGVSEDGTGATTGSIQRNSTGNSWAVAPAINSFNACNPGFAILPVSFTAFSARKNTSGVELNWAAYNSDNDAVFHIEHSVDGIRFSAIGNLPAVNGDHRYSFTHNTDVKGLVYYRIASVIPGQSIKYSAVIKVNAATKGLSLNSLFPSPASAIISLQINSDKKQNARLEILDLNGRTMAVHTLGLQEGIVNYPLAIQTLSSGTYLIRISTAEETITGRFIKK